MYPLTLPPRAEAPHPPTTRADASQAEISTDARAGPTQPSCEETTLDLPVVSRLLEGRYLVLSEIGRGGMGVAYLARHKQGDRLVVLKVLHSGCFSNELEREQFRRESEVAAQLEHPGVIEVLEAGEVDSCPYCCLEYIEGPSLAQWLNQSPLPCREAARLLRLIALAVQHTHERGFVHCDLKPANILLDAQFQPRLIDFGLARKIGTVTDRDRGAIVGTPLYMAPEQAAGKAELTGPASDIYSLGAILYEMLASRPPFGGGTLLATLRQVMEEVPTPPSRINPRAHPELEAICLRCLKKDPARRYPSALALADDLERYLGSQELALPLAQQPTTPLEPVPAPSSRLLSGLRTGLLLLALVLLLQILPLAWLTRSAPPFSGGKALLGGSLALLLLGLNRRLRRLKPLSA